MCDKKEVKRIYSKIGSLLCSSRLNNNYYAQTILRIHNSPATVKIVLPFNARMFYGNILFLVLGSMSKERKIAPKILYCFGIAIGNVH